MHRCAPPARVWMRGLTFGTRGVDAPVTTSDRWDRSGDGTEGGSERSGVNAGENAVATKAGTQACAHPQGAVSRASVTRQLGGGEREGIAVLAGVTVDETAGEHATTVWPVLAGAGAAGLLFGAVGDGSVPVHYQLSWTALHSPPPCASVADRRSSPAPSLSSHWDLSVFVTKSLSRYRPGHERA